MCDRIVDKVGESLLTPVSITAGKGFVPQSQKFGRDISGAQYKNYISLRKGDFAYNKGNSKSYPQGCVRRLKEFDQAAAPSAFISFRLHDGFVPEFFEGLFEKNAHGRQLIKFITSSARSDGLLNISPDEFFRVNLPIPQDPAEQQKIADCLSSLDGLIAAEGRALEALKAHKKGLMQQLFPQPGETQPRLRFPEFRDAGGWTRHTLSHYVSALDAGVSVNAGDRPARNGEIGVLKTSCVTTGTFDHTENKVVLEPEELGRVKESVQRDTIIMSRMNTIELVGANAYVEREITNLYLPDRLWAAKPTANGNMRFLSYILGSDQGRAFLSNLAAGSSGSMKNISKSEVLSIPILVPSLAEQQKIADCLTAIDTKIAAQTAKIDALKTHKRGLMQQLFPAPEEQ